MKYSIIFIITRRCSIKVFISHQKNDRIAAGELAAYIQWLGIDVYFDEYDIALQVADQTNNPNGVVSAIKKGINSSTHMLCVVSPNTLTSEWVPFEVGYGYDNTDLAVVTLKGISDFNLPDYIRVVKMIRGYDGLDSFLLSKSGGRRHLVESNIRKCSAEGMYFSVKKHPLSSIMDK